MVLSPPGHSTWAVPALIKGGATTVYIKAPGQVKLNLQEWSKSSHHSKDFHCIAEEDMPDHETGTSRDSGAAETRHWRKYRLILWQELRSLPKRGFRSVSEGVWRLLRRKTQEDQRIGGPGPTSRVPSQILCIGCFECKMAIMLLS